MTTKVGPRAVRFKVFKIYGNNGTNLIQRVLVMECSQEWYVILNTGVDEVYDDNAVNNSLFLGLIYVHTHSTRRFYMTILKSLGFLPQHK